MQPYFDEAFYMGFDFSGCEPGLDADFEDVAEREYLTIAYWQVDDIEACIMSISKSGAGLIINIKEVGGFTKIATVSDLRGNTTGLIEEE